MDNHERGWEVQPGRLDIPLPEWRGGRGGDFRKLPRVVQKLLRRRKLTAEEKAELLWRFHELDQEARARNRARIATLVIAGTLLVAATAWLFAHPPQWLLQSIVSLLGSP